MNFKVGDRVRVLVQPYPHSAPIGTVATITTTVLGILLLDNNKWTTNYKPSQLELIDMNPLDFKIRGHLNGIKYPCLVDVKYDGITVLMTCHRGKPIVLKTSTGAEYTMGNWVPHEDCKDESGIFLAEWISGEGFSGDLTKILSERVDKTKINKTTFKVFDLIELNGRDFTSTPLVDRKLSLTQRNSERIVQGIIVDNFEELDAFTKQVIAAGYEGVVVKNLHETFHEQTWVKIKIEDEVSLTVTKVENTRIEVTFGTVIVGLRRSSKEVAVGDIVNVVHNGITYEGSLRNPRLKE